jgi:hypothetical protein
VSGSLPVIKPPTSVSLTPLSLLYNGLPSVRIFAMAPAISADEILRAFHGDAPYLFLGAAFVSAGLVSASLAVLRRKRDLLLIYFALFAVLYGWSIETKRRIRYWGRVIEELTTTGQRKKKSFA